MVKTCPTSVHVGSHVRLRTRNIIDGVKRLGAKGQLLAGTLAYGAEGKSEISGLAIATSQFNAGVQTTVPSVQKAPMLGFLVS